MSERRILRQPVVVVPHATNTSICSVRYFDETGEHYDTDFNVSRLWVEALFVEFDRETLAQELNKNRIADEITGALEQGYDPTDAVWKVIEDSGVLGLLDPKGDD